MASLLDTLADRSAVKEPRLHTPAGLGQEQKQAWRAGHIPGATCWDWKAMLWDDARRDFPAPEEFARRCGQAGRWAACAIPRRMQAAGAAGSGAAAPGGAARASDQRTSR